MEIVIRLNEEDLKDNVVLNMVNNLFKQNKVLGKQKQVKERFKRKVIVYDDLGCLVGTFTSAYQIEKSLGLDKGNVSKCIRGERRSFKGYTFKQVG